MTTSPTTDPLDSGRLLFGRHPSMWLSTLGAILLAGPALGIPGLSGEQVAGINVAVAALLAAVWAWQVRPIAPAVYTSAVAAIAGLAAAYGLDVPSETVGVVQGIVVQVLGLIAWGQVSPAGSRTAVSPPAPAPVIATGQQTVPSAVKPQRLTAADPGAHRAAPPTYLPGRASGGTPPMGINPPRTY
jgi:hypothetical protein